MRVNVDFETRSVLKLGGKKGEVDAWTYSRHPSTEALCLSVITDDDEFIWFPDKFRPARETAERISTKKLAALAELANNNKEVSFHAFNAWFEKCIWRNILAPLYGVPVIKPSRWHCTAALALSYGLPRTLDMVGRVLDVSEQKSAEGVKVCRSTMRPKRITAKMLKDYKDPEAIPEEARWVQDGETLAKLHEYCVQDARAERAISDFLKPLSKTERKIWLLDQKINARGLTIDTDAVKTLVGVISKLKTALQEKFKAITGLKPSQSVAFKQWLENNGVEIENARKEVLEEYLAKNPDMPALAKKAVQLKLDESLGSLKKLDAMLAKADPDDGRLRENFRYYAASTGRWGGIAVQFHNLPRKGTDDIEAVIRDARKGADFMELIYKEPLQEIKGCIRGLIKAPPGKIYVTGDFSAIEGRGLAWAADETEILEAYRKGLDVYKIAAASIFNKPYEEIDDGEERKIGKVCELALGYEGWINAFDNMAGPLKDKFSEKQKKQFILTWREHHPATVRFWANQQATAIAAYNDPGCVYSCGDFIKYIFDARRKSHRTLKMLLPSGRAVHYFDPKVFKREKRGKLESVLTYWTLDKGRWVRVETYGGKLTENSIQAMSRDILAEALLNLEKAGFPVVLHVHDEGMAEMEKVKGKSYLEDFLDAMCIPPKWAPDFPLKAEGWEGERYRKG